MVWLTALANVPSPLETGIWTEKEKLKIDDFIQCGGTGSKDCIRRGSTSGQRSVCSCVEKVFVELHSDAYGDFP